MSYLRAGSTRPTFLLNATWSSAMLGKRLLKGREAEQEVKAGSLQTGHCCGSSAASWSSWCRALGCDSSPPYSPGRSWVTVTPPSRPRLNPPSPLRWGDTQALPYLGEQKSSKVQVWNSQGPTSSPQVRPSFTLPQPDRPHLSSAESYPWP